MQKFKEYLVSIDEYINYLLGKVYRAYFGESMPIGDLRPENNAIQHTQRAAPSDTISRQQVLEEIDAKLSAITDYLKNYASQSLLKWFSNTLDTFLNVISYSKGKDINPQDLEGLMDIDKYQGADDDKALNLEAKKLANIFCEKIRSKMGRDDSDSNRPLRGQLAYDQLILKLTDRFENGTSPKILQKVFDIIAKENKDIETGMFTRTYGKDLETDQKVKLWGEIRSGYLDPDLSTDKMIQILNKQIKSRKMDSDEMQKFVDKWAQKWKQAGINPASIQAAIKTVLDTNGTSPLNS